MAVSNPCVELWFLLHFQDQHAVIDRTQVQRRVRELIGCEKVPTTDALTRLCGRYEHARNRAQKLDTEHELNGSPPGANPSSGLWRLIDHIRTP